MASVPVFLREAAAAAPYQNEKFMSFPEKSLGRLRELLRKRRLSVQRADDGHELWHMHISVAGIVSALIALALVLFISILMLVAYTPVLEFLPGYRTEATRSRERLVANILRIDSLERMMNDMLAYNEDITLVLEGRSPVVRNIATADSTKVDKSFVPTNAADSVLRMQLEGDGPYGLGQAGNSRRSVREAIEMVPPVDGIITRHFDTKQADTGIDMATQPQAEVAAVGNGTVVFSIWNPDRGYSVGVQHAGNLLSMYENLSQSHVVPGQRVRSGESLGVTAGESRGDREKRAFRFALWNDGKAVDPEAYIVF